MNNINDIMNDIAHFHYQSHRAALLKMSIRVHTTVAIVASVCYGNSGNSLFRSKSTTHQDPGSLRVIEHWLQSEARLPSVVSKDDGLDAMVEFFE